MGIKKIYGKAVATGGFQGDIIGDAGSVGTAELANSAVTYAKMQNVTATDKVLGRATAEAGVVEEIACTAAGRALIDDANAGAQRATLGLGALATLATVGSSEIDAGAVTNTKIGANAVTSAKIATNVIQRAVKQLTNTELVNVRGTPIELIAAPGANFAIIVDEIYLVLDAAAGAYTESADNLVVEYGDGTDIVEIEATGLVDSAAVSIRVIRPAVALYTPIANSKVQLFNNGDGEFGGGNAANTLSVAIIYRIVSTVAFTT